MIYKDYADRKGIVLSFQQLKIAKALEDYSDVAVRNGHSVGVTHLGALVASYHLDNDNTSTIYLFGPNYAITRDVLYKQLKLINSNISDFHNRIHCGSPSEIRFRTTGGNNIVIVDEADSISSEYSSSLDAMTNSKNSKLYIYGNPIRDINSKNPTLLKHYFLNTDVEKLSFSPLEHENVKYELEGLPAPIKGNPISVKWINRLIENWCTPADKPDSRTFEFQGVNYYPNREFRSRVLASWT